MEMPEQDDIVYALSALPNFSRDGVCFAARASGLYRSEDGGSTWSCAYDTLELQAPLATSAVAVSPCYGITDEVVFAGANGGILRSLDGGKIWSITELPAPAPMISSLALSLNFQDDHSAFAGTLEDGVFVSTDGGNSWDSWNFGLVDLHVLCLLVSPSFEQDKTLFAGTESGIFASRNAGRSWRELDFPMESAPVISLAISPQFADDWVLYAGTEAHGLFVSSDGGKTWARLAEFAGEPVNAIVLNPNFATRRELLVLAGSVLQSSFDGGNTWQILSSEKRTNQLITCVCAPNGFGLNAPLLIGFSGGDVI